MDKNLNAKTMLRALAQLDALLDRPLSLIVGGGGAMLLAYKFPLATSDIDAVPKGIGIDELKPLIEQVAKEMNLPPDWLNPWFSSFTHVLNTDFRDRLVSIYNGKMIRAEALGKEDLLLMKCFAHRRKDVAHARALVRLGANVKMVSARIEVLEKKQVPGCEAALEFLDEIVDMEEG